MNKKVGMLSFHDSLSYGATLQCFALQKAIKKMGYEAEFIDFQRKKTAEFKANSNNANNSSIKTKVKNTLVKASNVFQNIMQGNNNKLVDEKFKTFKKENIAIGNKEFTSIEDVCNYNFDYDTFVTGSDQIWNPNSSFLKIYGLEFVPDEKNTISYAASMGMGTIPENKKEIMYNSVHKIRHISCREKEGSESLSKLLKRNVETVIDPTFLLTKNEWEEYLSDKKLPSKYVLCFFLGSLDFPRKVAEKIAKENGCELIVIPGSPKDIFSKGTKVKGCGPKEFLSLFKNAEFICTDSFHGTAFSINFNKPFYAFCKRDFKEKTSTITRLINLLDILGLSDRMIYSEDLEDYSLKPIDYEVANEKLKIERDRSLEFLKESLEDC